MPGEKGERMDRGGILHGAQKEEKFVVDLANHRELPSGSLVGLIRILLFSVVSSCHREAQKSLGPIVRDDTEDLKS